MKSSLQIFEFNLKICGLQSNHSLNINFSIAIIRENQGIFFDLGIVFGTLFLSTFLRSSNKRFPGIMLLIIYQRQFYLRCPNFWSLTRVSNICMYTTWQLSELKILIAFLKTGTVSQEKDSRKLQKTYYMKTENFTNKLWNDWRNQMHWIFYYS